MMTPEQLMAQQKAAVESLFGLTAKAFESMEKLVELNVATAKATLNDTAAHAQAVMSVKDAQELISLQSGMLQPLAEKTAAYQRQVYEIASGSASELGKAVESKVNQAQANFAAMVDTASQNAPAGSETAVAMMKSAMSAAQNAYESVQKAVKQASDVAEANITQLTKTATQAVPAASKARK